MDEISTRIADDLQTLDSASRDAHEWRSYKGRLHDRIAQSVRTAQPLLLPDQKRAIAALRDVYQILYVADRIRTDAVRNRRPLPPSLLHEAERLLANPNAKSRDAQARSEVEERYAVGARVNWHKLLKRQKSEVQAQDSDAGHLDSIPELRAHIARQLNELLALVEERTVAIGSRGRQHDRPPQGLSSSLPGEKLNEPGKARKAGKTRAAFTSFTLGGAPHLRPTPRADARYALK